MIQSLKDIQNFYGIVRAHQIEQSRLSANPPFLSRKGSTFKVEIRKTCKTCGGPITINRYRTFCSKTCRIKNINQRNFFRQKIWQRERKDRDASFANPNKIQCQVCGRWYSQVGSHVWQRHKMTARDYRKQYGFDVKRGQLPDWLRKIKSEQVFENNTIKNLKIGKKYWFKRGQPGVGVYERSPETMFRLHNLHKTKMK
jgi:Asp-tRNA(Asn)/Glu-tRNA(Gln) amidotransferase B subunit